MKDLARGPFLMEKEREKMYQRDTELEGILYEVMEEHENISHLKELRIVALVCDKVKRKGDSIVYADCSKVTPKMEALCDADFVITFYLPNIDGISPNALRTLCWHELMHVGWDGRKKTTVPHNLEDFREIIEAHGVNWIDEQ